MDEVATQGGLVCWMVGENTAIGVQTRGLSASLVADSATMLLQLNRGEDGPSITHNSPLHEVDAD